MSIFVGPQVILNDYLQVDVRINIHIRLDEDNGTLITGTDDYPDHLLGCVSSLVLNSATDACRIR